MRNGTLTVSPQVSTCRHSGSAMAFRPKRTSSVPEPSTHPLTFVMGVQFLTFFAIVLTLGSRWLPRSQALLRPQICTRSSVQCRGCTSLLERDVGGSCSMSSSPLTRSGPGSIILGSKSFTRKMIVEEMGFAPIIRYGLRKFISFFASHRINSQHKIH